jgi:hypothetical protein
MTDRTEQNAIVKISEDGITIIGTVPVVMATDLEVAKTHQLTTITAEVLETPGTTLKAGITVKTDDDNAGDIWVGRSDVAVNNGMRLGPGESIPIMVDSTSKVYVIGAIGDRVHYIGG